MIRNCLYKKIDEFEMEVISISICLLLSYKSTQYTINMGSWKKQKGLTLWLDFTGNSRLAISML